MELPSENELPSNDSIRKLVNSIYRGDAYNYALRLSEFFNNTDQMKSIMLSLISSYKRLFNKYMDINNKHFQFRHIEKTVSERRVGLLNEGYNNRQLHFFFYRDCIKEMLSSLLGLHIKTDLTLNDIRYMHNSRRLLIEQEISE